MAETNNLKARIACRGHHKSTVEVGGEWRLGRSVPVGIRFAFCKDKRRRNLKQAFSMWKAAAEQGHVRARFYLGTCYDFGSGTRRNLKRAMFWYHQAAVANHDVAQYNLALGYRDGLGVPRSRRVAVKWLRVSAAAGNPEPHNDLGYRLHEGLGMKKIDATPSSRISELRNRACSELSSTLVSAIAMATASRLAICKLANGFSRLLAAGIQGRVKS
jgi:TPR repeat protein